MITKETTIYFCEHCKKLYQRPKWCEKHELLCKKNPANNRPCFGCNHLTSDDVDYGNYDPDNDISPTVHVLCCNKRELYIYPPWVTRPYHEEELGLKNIPMPKKCDEVEE